ncbi:MAG: 50S ribosomal protein L18 [Kiritimatiellae bacterium]|nr:50S ribosomal protein L18 [Kiritimatiellia bacterium]
MSFNRKEQRTRRHLRIRQRIKGTAERPRMAICVSNKHMYVQFIDDIAMHTLASSSTLKEGQRCNIESAKKVGTDAAEAAKASGISVVVVDRGGFAFHGRVKQIVDAAVEAGLKVTVKEKKDNSKEAK